MQESNAAATIVAKQVFDNLEELTDDLETWLEEGARLPNRNQSELKFFSNQLFEAAKAMQVAATFSEN